MCTNGGYARRACDLRARHCHTKCHGADALYVDGYRSAEDTGVDRQLPTEREKDWALNHVFARGYLNGTAILHVRELGIIAVASQTWRAKDIDELGGLRQC